MPCPYSTMYRSFDSLKALGLPPVLQGLPAPALSGSRISTTLHERVGGLNRGNPSKRTGKTIDRGSKHDAVISFDADGRGWSRYVRVCEWRGNEVNSRIERGNPRNCQAEESCVIALRRHPARLPLRQYQGRGPRP